LAATRAAPVTTDLSAIIPVLEGRDLVPNYTWRSFPPQANHYDRRTQIFPAEAARFSISESWTLGNVVVDALDQGKRDLDALRLYDLDGSDRAWATAAGLPVYAHVV
jgi:hypothetical protein